MRRGRRRRREEEGGGREREMEGEKGEAFFFPSKVAGGDSRRFFSFFLFASSFFHLLLTSFAFFLSLSFSLTHSPLSLYHSSSSSQDVLKYYGATEYGSGPPALGSRSPRESFDPRGARFLRERGTYAQPQPHP